MALCEHITPVVLVSNDEYFLPYALEASRGFFARYVIYDIGSTDQTRTVIRNFIDSCGEGISFFVRNMPMLPPSVQGAFRNSMIAETLSDWYFILDGDEVYAPESYRAIVDSLAVPREPGKIYGVVRRIEVAEDMESAYGQDQFTPHHRLYHRMAIWTGNHPGEVPMFKQEERTQFVIDGATCVHFHNCPRSEKDAEVPKRLERRARPTYRPGEKSPFNVFEAAPVMCKRVGDTPQQPRLAELQRKK